MNNRGWKRFLAVLIAAVMVGNQFLVYAHAEKNPGDTEAAADYTGELNGLLSGLSEINDELSAYSDEDETVRFDTGFSFSEEDAGTEETSDTDQYGEDAYDMEENSPGPDGQEDVSDHPEDENDESDDPLGAERYGDYEYEILNGTYAGITAYKGTDTVISIPERMGSYEVSRIGKNAFKGKTAITQITIPSGVQTIQDYAFQNCSALETVSLGTGLETVGTGIFYGCTSLNHVTIPGSLTTIGNYMFYGCTSLSSIDLKNVTGIGNYAFYNCSGLTSFDLKKTVTIGAYAFSGCTGLTRMDFPDSVATITYRAFYNCTNLQSIGYPMGWTTAERSTIDNGTWKYGCIFEGCTALKSITVPEGITSIPEYAFFGCNKLEEL
ncbi:MAG: leucine-rich repeat protein, partial [Lachnospiraceae bacterium]|nr:leucine-rich repeat protein [Lachnospiraceae bacterium]